MTDTTQPDRATRKPDARGKGPRNKSAAQKSTQQTRPAHGRANNGNSSLRTGGGLESAIRLALIGGFGIAAGVAADRFGVVESMQEVVASATHAAAQQAGPGISPAISAVLNALPSVAILGEKEGPGGTTEVFIQVPGVLNMQSVYVLSDNKTVISGVVVEPVESVGFPGRDIQRPTGKATVNPLDPRTNLNEMTATLGGQRTTALSRSPAAQTVQAPADINVPTPTHAFQASAPNTTAGEGREAPATSTGSTIPEPPAASTNAATANDATSASVDAGNASSPSVATVPEPSAPSEPSPEASGQFGNEQSSSAVPAEQAVVSQGTVQNYNGDEPFIIESIDAMVGAGPFGKAVRHMLKNDKDIDAVRQQSGAKEQQQAYYDLIRSLPAVTQGTGPREIFVMFDPNCPVCHKYYQYVYNDIQRGRLTVHWIPVIVFPDERSSLTASAAILAAIDRDDGAGDILHRAMTEPGYTAQVDQSDRIEALTPYLESVVKNTSVMAMSKAETPLLIFQNSQGNLMINGGMPQDGYISLIGMDG